MDIEEFSNAVLAAVKDKADGAFKARMITITKNNGIKMTGIVSVVPGSKGGPCIYLDSYYEEYRKGRTEIREVIGKVCRQLMEHKDDLRDFSMDSLCYWDVVKTRIYVKLINREMNTGLLGAVPHRQFLDLSAVYYIKLEGKGGIPTILIYNEHMLMWRKDEEELYQTAMKNMRLEGEALFEDMDMVFKRMMPEHADFLADSGALQVSMYVLSNRSKFFGAAEILDSNTLKSIGNRLGEDFVILPSSVHETIIIPSSKAPEYSELADQVREVNEEDVEIGERLSNHVYLYSRNERTLKIVA